MDPPGLGRGHVVGEGIRAAAAPEFQNVDETVAHDVESPVERVFRQVPDHGALEQRLPLPSQVVEFKAHRALEPAGAGDGVFLELLDEEGIRRPEGLARLVGLLGLGPEAGQGSLDIRIRLPAATGTLGLGVFGGRDGVSCGVHKPVKPFIFPGEGEFPFPQGLLLVLDRLVFHCFRGVE